MALIAITIKTSRCLVGDSDTSNMMEYFCAQYKHAWWFAKKKYGVTPETHFATYELCKPAYDDDGEYILRFIFRPIEQL